MTEMDVALKEMMLVDGAIGAAVVDYTSGMALGTVGGSKTLDLQVAAAGNTEVVRAKMRTIEQLGLNEEIEDILITMAGQYHIVRPMAGRKARGLFLYVILDRSRGNLAMAQRRLKEIDKDLDL